MGYICAFSSNGWYQKNIGVEPLKEECPFLHEYKEDTELKVKTSFFKKKMPEGIKVFESDKSFTTVYLENIVKETTLALLVKFTAEDGEPIQTWIPKQVIKY